MGYKLLFNNKFFPLIIFISSLITLCNSCATKTRTITPLTGLEKSRINKLAIHVKADEELEAYISRIKPRFYEGMNTSSAGMGAVFMIPVILAAVIVEESVRSKIDTKHANEFGEDMEELDIDKLLSESLDEYFETSGADFDAEITVLQNTSVLAQKGYDTLLDITINKLEVKLCPKPYIYGVAFGQEGEGPYSSEVAEIKDSISRWNEIHPKYDRKFSRKLYKNPNINKNLYSIDTEKNISIEQDEDLIRIARELEELSPVIAKYNYRAGDSVRFWIDFKGRLISTSDNKVIWDREELYYDPKCYYVEDMQNNPELVVNMLTKAIGDIAVNVVNEIQ